MSVIITGLVIHNTGKTSVALTAADGPQTFSEELEARLVSQGVAKYVGEKPAHREPASGGTVKEVATAVGEANGQDASNNPPDDDAGSNGAENAQGIPKYSVDMKAAELREIMEDCGLQYKVGMSKADMVAALDAYFGDEVEDEDTPPDLGAEDPVL
jgi:hypothetical protein